MADKRKLDQPTEAVGDESAEDGTEQTDTEGHVMLPDTGASQVLASSRFRDIERDVRIRRQKNEGRPNNQRGR